MSFSFGKIVSEVLHAVQQVTKILIAMDREEVNGEWKIFFNKRCAVLEEKIR
jgi:hypothetical protein